MATSGPKTNYRQITLHSNQKRYWIVIILLFLTVVSALIYSICQLKKLRTDVRWLEQRLESNSVQTRMLVNSNYQREKEVKLQEKLMTERVKYEESINLKLADMKKAIEHAQWEINQLTQNMEHYKEVTLKNSHEFKVYKDNNDEVTKGLNDVNLQEQLQSVSKLSTTLLQNTKEIEQLKSSIEQGKRDTLELSQQLASKITMDDQLDDSLELEIERQKSSIQHFTKVIKQQAEMLESFKTVQEAMKQSKEKEDQQRGKTSQNDVLSNWIDQASKLMKDSLDEGKKQTAAAMEKLKVATSKMGKQVEDASKVVEKGFSKGMNEFIQQGNKASKYLKDFADSQGIILEDVALLDSDDVL